MSTDYPTLTQMGVTHPGQITRYALSSWNYIDYLRIVYRRPKGSLRSTSRTYQFPRKVRKLQKAGDRDVTEQLSRDPVLVTAIAELDSLLEARAKTETVIAELRQEIGALQAELSGRIETLNAIVERLERG